MKQEPDISLQKITEECQRMLNIKPDNYTIEEKDISCVHAVRPKLKSAKEDIKPSLCYRCGGLHFKKRLFLKISFLQFFFLATKVHTAEGKKIWKKTVLSN